MRLTTTFGWLAGLWVALSTLASAQTTPTSSTFIDPRDTLRRQLLEEQRRMADPETGNVPVERLQTARERVSNAIKAGSFAQSGIPNITWQERGPTGYADVMAVLLDPADATRKKAWVGLAAGGIWFTNDITSTLPVWYARGENLAGQRISSLVADPTNPQVMYAGTGETNYYKSTGIWKSTDGGNSWNLLASTVPTGVDPSIGRAFETVHRIVVNANGHVFVASRLGVLKSTDGGTTWQTILAPNQSIGFSQSSGIFWNDFVSDLEIASDGVVYAAFWPSRLFKSTNAAATTWAEITPVGAPTGERTELGVALSTSGAGQVLYAVTRGYNNVNYSQDVRWFKKSADAGLTWTDVTIPAPNSSSHFTWGNGYQNLNLTVHPSNANLVFAGGYVLMRTIDGGTSWTTLNELSGNGLWSQRGLVLVPGSNALLNVNQRGLYWLAEGANVSVAAPTGVRRSDDMQAAMAYNVAMKSSPGSNYFLANVQPAGVVTMTTPANNGIGSVSSNLRGTYAGSPVFVDTDEPNIQLIPGYSTVSVFDGNSTSLLHYVNGNGDGAFIADYDSQANTLYAYTLENGQHMVKRTTGIGTSPTSTTFALTGFTDRPTYLKLSGDRTVLFAGSFNGKLFRITNINQPSPTITRIDDGAFGQVAVSSIDVGATDNQLLVTVSNYGSPSVWYTADGGGSWLNKDLLSHGLPDVPVWMGMFNAQNRQQVLLGTELGVWTTTNITATNPGWEVSPGFPLLRVNQLRYRASDGKLAATTAGRGIWTTDAFAIPYTLPTVTLTGVSTTSLCAGSTFTVSFNTTGTFGPGNQFDIWLSDATGNFLTQRRIGSSTSSPVSVTLPSGYSSLPYGTDYKVRVMSTNAEVESNPSALLAVGNLNYAYTQDRAGYTSGANVCTGSQVTLTLRTQDIYYNTVPVGQCIWAKDGAVLSGVSAATLTTTQPGYYSATVVQAGCIKPTSSPSGYNLVHGSMSTGFGMQSSVTPQCDGQELPLRVYYSGDNATYQWRRNGVAITGAVASTYAAAQTGRYTVLVQDLSCQTETGSQYYEFGSAFYASAYFGYAGDTTACSADHGAYLYVNYGSGTATIQWYKDGQPVAGGTGYSLYIQGGGVFYAAVRKGNCLVYTNALTRTIRPQIPVVIAYNGSAKLCPAETRYLSFQRVNNGTYQWQRNGVDISGATGSGYTVTTEGTYTVRASYGTSCTTVSDGRSFTYSNALAPALMAEYGITQACFGAYLYTTDFYFGHQSTQGYSYQWYKDGAPVPGATSSSYYAGATGSYSLSITKGTCTGTSNNLYMQTGSIDKPTLSVIESTLDRCVNSAVQLRGNAPWYYVYQWKRNGVNIPSATSATYYATQPGEYVLMVSNGSCSANSDPIALRIGEPTAATLTGRAVVNAGQTTYLPITFAGAAPWSVTLSNGQTVGGIMQNPYSLSVAPTATTTYSLSAMANACGTGVASGSAVVTIGSGNADVSLDMVVSSRTPRVGEVVSYSVLVSNAGPQEAVSVQVQSRLPVGTSFAQAISPEVTHNNGTISIAAGNVPVNATTVYVFQATITDPGTLVTAAQVTNTNTPDPDSQPNSGTGDGQDDATQAYVRTADRDGPLMASANPNQMPLPALRSNQPAPNASAVEVSLHVALDKNVADVAKKETVTATITLRNRGGLTATNVALQVLLPNGEMWPPVQSGWRAANDQAIDGYVSNIPVGGSVTIPLRWRPSAPGTLKAQVMQVNEPTTGSVPGNGYEQGEKDEAQASIRVR